MIMKKRAKIIFLLLFIIVSYGGYRLFINWLEEPVYPVVPNNSSKNKVILTSRGCCFYVTDATVLLIDESGSETVLISEDTVYEYDIYECNNIPEIDSPIQVIINFSSHYNIDDDVSLLVGEFSNTSELQKNGLLLRFGDGDLTVRNGNNEKFFRAGVFGDKGDKSPWYQDLKQ